MDNHICPPPIMTCYGLSPVMFRVKYNNIISIWKNSKECEYASAWAPVCVSYKRSINVAPCISHFVQSEPNILPTTSLPQLLLQLIIFPIDIRLGKESTVRPTTNNIDKLDWQFSLTFCCLYSKLRRFHKKHENRMEVCLVTFGPETSFQGKILILHRF